MRIGRWRLSEVKGYCLKCRGECFVRQTSSYAANSEVMCFPCGLRWSADDDGPSRGGYPVCYHSKDQAFRLVHYCRLCNSQKLAAALDLGETPLANELDGTELFPLVVMRCEDCGHHQLSIAVNPERLWGKNYPYQSGTSPVFRKHLEALADEVATLKPGGRVLEIASNDGTLCAMLASRNLEALGIDPSGPQQFTEPELVRAAWPCPLDAYWSAEKADIILALNVFAHVDDLHSFTAAVKEALAPDGVFIVEVGYLGSPQKAIWDTIYHEHLSYHDLTSLWPFFVRHGLAIDSFSFNESQGDSVRIYVKHTGQTTAKGPSVDGWSEGFSQLAWRHSRIDDTRDALRSTMTGHVSGFGCPAKAVTLAFVTGITSQLQEIFDDNPLKCGRDMPGTSIPIVPTDQLLVSNPNTLILFSWNFADEIIPRLRGMGYRGRIVVPFPEVRVYEA